jgi:hypothetical protein
VKVSFPVCSKREWTSYSEILITEGIVPSMMKDSSFRFRPLFNGTFTYTRAVVNFACHWDQRLRTPLTSHSVKTCKLYVYTFLSLLDLRLLKLLIYRGQGNVPAFNFPSRSREFIQVTKERMNFIATCI